jgi:catechol 2,3-dioxygenase-like lactoylglutathione lyase family enzyme
VPADHRATTVVAHVGLAVDDLKRSVEFYASSFGARVVLNAPAMRDLIRRTTGLPEVTCDLAQLELVPGATLLELIEFRDVPPGRLDQAPVRPGHGHVCLVTADFDDTMARCVGLGAAVIGEVVEYPEGRAVYLREPGGSVLELEELTAATPTSREAAAQ